MRWSRTFEHTMKPHYAAFQSIHQLHPTNNVTKKTCLLFSSRSLSQYQSKDISPPFHISYIPAPLDPTYHSHLHAHSVPNKINIRYERVHGLWLRLRFSLIVLSYNTYIQLQVQQFFFSLTFFKTPFFSTFSNNS